MGIFTFIVLGSFNLEAQILRKIFSTMFLMMYSLGLMLMNLINWRLGFYNDLTINFS
jgi:hypothetical protein